MIQQNRIDVVKQLIENTGLSLNFKDKEGRNIFEVALDSENYGLIYYVLGLD